MSENEAIIAAKYKEISPFLNERTLRIWAAVEARHCGYGGKSEVARAIRISRTTLDRGADELAKGQQEETAARVRIKGGGRKRLLEKDPQLLQDLERLVDPSTRGDPMSPLRWTCKSTTKLAAALNQPKRRVSPRTVCALLDRLGYSLQSVRKRREGSRHPDRDAQFQHIAERVKAFQAAGQPVISVDTKKKELVGDFANKGQEWQPKGCPEEAAVHDFGKDKVAPYGIYDIARNQGWVSLGVDHDTAEFAVESIRRWWYKMGQSLYPKAQQLLITADGGGSNGSRVRLWKWKLQELADELKLEIQICHFLPGTRKWNKIEHRMFCHITENWRGRRLTSHEVVVNLIGQTTTKQGLTIRAELDTRRYPKGVKVSNQVMKSLRLEREVFHGEWNYKLKPRAS
jgi:hypothetical protein